MDEPASFENAKTDLDRETERQPQPKPLSPFTNRDTFFLHKKISKKQISKAIVKQRFITSHGKVVKVNFGHSILFLKIYPDQHFMLKTDTNNISK